jgi:hypothetical protein
VNSEASEKVRRIGVYLLQLAEFSQMAGAYEFAKAYLAALDIVVRIINQGRSDL